MQNKFISLPEFGQLFIIDVFVEYDNIPMIFVCTDYFSTLYLITSINSNENIEQWCLIKITKSLYNELLSNKISIQHAFIKNKLSQYYVIKYCTDTKIVSSDVYDCLPNNIVTNTNSYVGDFRTTKEESFSDLIQLSQNNSSSMIEVVFYPNEENMHFVDIDIHNKVSMGIRNMVRMKFPKSSKFSGNFSVGMAASYVMRLSFPDDSTELLKGTADKAIQSFIELINTPSEKVIDKYKDNIKYLNEYQNVITGFAETKDYICINSVTSDSYEIQKNVLTVDHINLLKTNISEFIKNQKENLIDNNNFDTEKKICFLINIDMNSRKFGLQEVSTKYEPIGIEIEGNLADDLKQETYQISDKSITYYEATLKVFKTNKKTRYELSKLNKQA